MIFLYSIFHGATGVIREWGPIKEHCEMFFTFTAPCIPEEYDAYTMICYNFTLWTGVCIMSGMGAKKTTLDMKCYFLHYNKLTF